MARKKYAGRPAAHVSANSIEFLLLWAQSNLSTCKKANGLLYFQCLHWPHSLCYYWQCSTKMVGNGSYQPTCCCEAIGNVISIAKWYELRSISLIILDAHLAREYCWDGHMSLISYLTPILDLLCREKPYSLDTTQVHLLHETAGGSRDVH